MHIRTPHPAIGKASAIAGATVLCAALISGMSAPARADVLKIHLQIDGYSDLFKSCEFSLGFEAPDNYGSIVLDYDIHIKGKKQTSCTARKTTGSMIDTTCTTPPDVEAYSSCDDLTKVQPMAINCLDTSGAPLDCSRITIVGPPIFSFD